MTCDRCGQTLEIADWPFCPHGTMRNFTVRPDSIPGGIVIENLTKTPTRYYSHSAIKLAQEMAGVVPHVRHVGTQGSDKSPHTSRWI